MFMVTTLSFDELGQLIKDKQISLDNSKLLFGMSTDWVDAYFRDNIGYNGYVVGLRGRLNKITTDLCAAMDKQVRTGGRVILEAEIDESDVMRYRADGINAAATALTYGLNAEDIYEQLDMAQEDEKAPVSGVEVLCVPYIKSNGRIRVTSLTDNLSFNVEGITFVCVK